MRRWIASLVRRTIAVHLTDGQSIKGVLTGEYPDCLVLSHASFLGADGHTSVDGEAVIPRTQISWLQVVGEDS